MELINLTAKQAQKIAKSKKKLFIYNELIGLLDKIEGASRLGKYEISVRYEISIEVIAELKRRGFTVKDLYDYAEDIMLSTSYYEISWHEKDGLFETIKEFLRIK